MSAPVFDEEDVGGTESSVVVLIAPPGVGKTAYLAALVRTSLLGSYRAGGLRLRLGTPRGVGPGARESETSLSDAYSSLLLGETTQPTAYANLFAQRIFLLAGGASSQSRELVFVDTQGGHLFPLADQPLDGTLEPLQQRRLVQVLEEAGVSSDDVTLLVFVNEHQDPTAGDRMRHSVPKPLADFLDGVEVRRISFFVGCSDTLFPRGGDLRSALGQLNRGHDIAAAEFSRRFRGSPQHAFVRDLIGYLHSVGGLVGPDVVSFWWGSSLGVLSESGRANTRSLGGVYSLAEPGDWTPLGVVEPLLWMSRLALGDA